MTKTSLLSGNTFGARFWSDQKPDAPMLPFEPPFGRCPECGTNFWTSDLKVVDSVFPPDDVDPSLPSVGRLTLDEMVAALQQPWAKKPERQKALRYVAVWSHNDAYRSTLSPDEETPPWAPTGAHLAIAKTLSEDLRQSPVPQEVLMAAELLRECGEFEGCIQLLNRDWSPALQIHASAIAAAASDKKAAPFEIVREPSPTL